MSCRVIDMCCRVLDMCYRVIDMCCRVINICCRVNTAEAGIEPYPGLHTPEAIKENLDFRTQVLFGWSCFATLPCVPVTGKAQATDM